MQFIERSIQRTIIRELFEDYDSGLDEGRWLSIVEQETKELLKTYDFTFTKNPREGGFIDRTLFNIDETNCQARIWNEGYGGQCSRKQLLDCELCGKHQDMIESQGSLWLGKITDDRPEAPIYRGPSGTQNVPKKWK